MDTHLHHICHTNTIDTNDSKGRFDFFDPINLNRLHSEFYILHQVVFKLDREFLRSVASGMF